MALIVKIQVNNTRLLIISAVRVEGNTDKDSLNKYLITSTDYREDSDGDTNAHGFIYHRYGDKAEILTLKMLGKVMGERYINI